MRPLILVSNDDSYSAKGVHCLIDRLIPFGDVVAVCPDAPRSGQSMAITVNDALKLTELPDYNGAKMYKVSGTPVDCVKLAMHHILPRKADLVVAGINHGSNSAVNVLYSGTMGAAMEGCAFGIPSIGFSLTDHSHDADFTPCYKAIDLLVKEVLDGAMRHSRSHVRFCLFAAYAVRTTLPRRGGQAHSAGQPHSGNSVLSLRPAEPHCGGSSFRFLHHIYVRQSVCGRLVQAKAMVTCM